MKAKAAVLPASDQAEHAGSASGRDRRARPPAARASFASRRTASAIAWPGLLAPPRVAHAMVAVLAGTTAIAMLAVGLTLVPAGSSEVAPAAAVQSTSIRGFYAAVNDVLAGGDPRLLDPFVAPEVIVHTVDRQISGRAALAMEIAALGAASPGLRLDLSDLVVEGDRAAATIALAPPASGILIDGAPSSRAETERFRLAGGRIAEYWRTLDDWDAMRWLPPLSLPMWRGSKQAGLARFTFPPGAALSDLVAPGPHLLLPETGTLAVSLEGQAEVARFAGGDGWRPTAEGRPLTIGGGDAVLVPGGVRHAIRNQTRAGASMLGVLLFSHHDLSVGSWYPPKPAPSALSSTYGSLPFGDPVEWHDRASSELLARGTDICAARQTANLVVSWLSLEPGQTIAPHAVNGVELLAVEAGAVLVGRAHPAIVTDPSKLRPGSEPNRGPGLDVSRDPRLATAGDGLAFSIGLSAAVGNGGTEAARLVLVRLEPAPAGGDLTPAARRLASQIAPDACRSDPPEVGGR